MLHQSQLPTGFHVRHDLQPDHTFELLTLLSNVPDGQTHDELHQAADQNGYRLRHRKDYDKLLRSLIDIDVVVVKDRRYSLTHNGSIIAHLTAYQTELLPDFIHFLYYTRFDYSPYKRFSWSYQQVCQSLWEGAPSIIQRDRLVNLVTREAAQAFDLNGISFSSSSVGGVINWLDALQPTCLQIQGGEKIFIRRENCSLELFTLALSHVFRFASKPETTYVPITFERREAVCRLCLITPDAFHEMLALTEACFPSIQVRRERGDQIAINNFSWSSLEN